MQTTKSLESAKRINQQTNVNYRRDQIEIKNDINNKIG